MDQHCLGIDSWVKTLAHDDLPALLIGCSPDALPPLGSYYDFINRLWLHIDLPLHLRFLDAKRHDMKWRCPAATGKEEKCTCKVPCSSSPYGRCLYTKP